MTASLYAAAQAAIAARRVLIEAGTAGPWFGDVGAFAFVMAPDLEDGASVAMIGDADEANTALIVAMHADYSRWLDALAETLERHAPRAGSEVCRAEVSAWWPCPDARSALTALGLGGE